MDVQCVQCMQCLTNSQSILPSDRHDGAGGGFLIREYKWLRLSQAEFYLTRSYQLPNLITVFYLVLFP